MVEPLLLAAQPTGDKPHASTEDGCLKLPKQFAVSPSRVVEPDSGADSKGQNGDDGNFRQQLTPLDGDSNSKESLILYVGVKSKCA